MIVLNQVITTTFFKLNYHCTFGIFNYSIKQNAIFVKFWFRILIPVAENPNKGKKIRDENEPWIQTSKPCHTAIWHGGGTHLSDASMFLKGEEVYCTSPVQVMMYQKKFQQRVTACQRVSLNIITFHLTVQSNIFLKLFFFFFDSKLHCEYSLSRKRNSITASYRTQSTEQNSLGHRFMLRKSYKSCLNCKTKCSLSFQLNSRALTRQNHLEKEKYSSLKSGD